jgi:hypothetical protein
MDRDILERPNSYTDTGPHFFKPLLNAAPVGIGIPIEKNRLCMGLEGQLFEFSDGITLPDDKDSTERFQVPGQRCQASTKEVLTVRSRPSVVFFPFAENVNGRDTLRRLHSRIERRVVSDSEIPSEPMDDVFQSASSYH